MDKFSKFMQFSHSLRRKKKSCPFRPYSCCTFGADIWGLFVWLKCASSNKDLRIKSPLLPNKSRTSSKPSSETARKDQQHSADSPIPVPWKPMCWRWPLLVINPPSQQRWLVSVAFLGPTAAAWAVSPPQSAPFSALDHQLAQAQGRTLLEKVQGRYNWCCTGLSVHRAAGAGEVTSPTGNARAA